MVSSAGTYRAVPWERGGQVLADVTILFSGFCSCFRHSGKATVRQSWPSMRMHLLKRRYFPVVLLLIVFGTASSAAMAVEAPASVAARLVDLGKALFFDPRFSADGTVSCASCHDPAKSFADGLPVPRGIHRRAGTRNTPTLLDLDAYRSFFWNGRAATLEPRLQGC